MTGKLDGKVALVSGAGRGIGREIALKLASEGARVVINDLDAAPAQDVYDVILKRGGQATTYIGSVTDVDFGDRFVQAALTAFGGIDIIVNNAGYTWDSVIQKMTDEQWYAMIDVHMTAPFRLLRAAQPYIKQFVADERSKDIVNQRKVVNITSVSGICGNAGQANYSSAKAGIIGLTKCLTKEWGRYNVNVNAVAFGVIMTRLTEATAGGDASITISGRDIKVGISEQVLESSKTLIPLGRPGTAEEAAGAVYLFCTPEANYISGQTVICGGGLEI